MVTLLDYLAGKLGCVYLSDLPRYRDTADMRALLLNISEQEYSLRDWNDALSYLFKKSLEYSSVSEAKEYYKNHAGLK